MSAQPEHLPTRPAQLIDPEAGLWEQACACGYTASGRLIDVHRDLRYHAVAERARAQHRDGARQ